MNVLVTGGAGFIGSHTVVALVNAGFVPVILDNFSNSKPEVLDGLEQIIGFRPKCYAEDCHNPAVLQRIFEEDDIEGIIHFAAFKAVGESMEKPLLYYDNNVSALIILLQEMLRANISTLIFSSSCTVYGSPEKLPVTEDTPMQPSPSVYGKTKQMGEEILHDVTKADNPMKIISLRYFNPVGAHSSGLIGELPLGVPSNLVPYVTQTAAGIRESLAVFGDDYDTPDGTCIRDYIHVMDLAEAHVAALQKLNAQTESTFYDTYNVGTGQGNSVLELVQTFQQVNDLPLNYHIAPRRSGDVEAVYADVSKIRQELGWNATRDLSTCLRDAWNWQQKISNM
jgi:UDP-glucose 4-epimerase